METDKRNGFTEPGRVEQSNHDMNGSNALRATRAHDDSQVAYLPLKQLNSMVSYSMQKRNISCRKAQGNSVKTAKSATKSTSPQVFDVPLKN